MKSVLNSYTDDVMTRLCSVVYTVHVKLHAVDNSIKRLILYLIIKCKLIPNENCPCDELVML